MTRQQFDYSCGSASLSTILTYYYNVEISEKEILESVLQSKGIDTQKQE
nr:cysteine peptidase family C39 domain-containing protein [Helicobacter saguini]